MRTCFHSLLKKSLPTHFENYSQCALLPVFCEPQLRSLKRVRHGLSGAEYLLGQRSTATASRRSRRRREKASAFSRDGTINYDSPPTLFLEAETPFKPPTRPPEDQKREPKAWVELIEPYLPSELRSPAFSGQTYRHENDHHADRRLLVNILYNARLHENGDLDILAHLGLVEQRWTAVLSLIEYLLEERNVNNVHEKEADYISNIPWPDPLGTTSLRRLCENPIDISRSIIQRESTPTCLNLGLRVREGVIVEDESDDPSLVMKQIWQSIGSIAIAAASYPPASLRSILGWIYQVLAVLHRKGLIPKSIYQYRVKNHTSSIKRSPVVYMLATRLLSALSITVFRREDQDIPDIKQRVRGGEPHPNVWLEFILWCCVDSGFVEESSWILAQLQSAKSRPEWRVVDWTSFEAKPFSSPGWFSNRRITDEGEEFLSQTEARTISSQVILATVDGLVNQFRRFDDAGEALRQPFLQKRIFSHLSLLGDQRETAPSVMTLNRLLVRIRETPGFVLQLYPGSVWHVVYDLQEMRTVEHFDEPSKTTLEAYASPFQLNTILQNTDPIFGSLHQALEQFCRLGDVRRALSMFDSIQYFIDRSRKRTIDLFGQRLQSSEDQGTTSSSAAEEGYFLPQGQPAPRTLGRLLDVLTYAGRHDIGRWLLYSADPDGPIINPIHYGVPQLSPALIRFAQATNDMELVSRVLATSRMTGSIVFLYSLLSLRFSFGQFDLAEDLLRYFKDSELGSEGEVGGYRIGSLASLAVVCIRLQMESQSSVQATDELQEATTLCERIFRGDFSNFFRFGRDFQAYREGLNGTLLRILQSFSNPLQETATRLLPDTDSKRLITLPPIAFNTLLSVVAETHGAVTGKRIYDQFCREPAEPANNEPHEDKALNLVNNDEGSEDPSAEEWWASYAQPIWNEPIRRGHRTISEDTIPFETLAPGDTERQQLAKPDIWTIRIILKAALKEIRVTDLSAEKRRELQSILDWSVGAFKKFGLKISDMIHEYGRESTRKDILPRRRIAALLYRR